MAGKHYTITMKVNGRPVGNVPPERLRSRVMKAAFKETVALNMEISRQMIEQSLLDRINDARRTHSRDVIDDTNTMWDAYESALKTQRQNLNGYNMYFRMLNTKIMDQMLPMKNSEEGWWRLYEYGTPGSRNGASTEYGFVSFDLLSKVFGNEFAEGNEGHHGEGIMVSVDGFIGSRLNIEPHKGVRPFRILQGAHNDASVILSSMRKRAAGQFVRSMIA